MEFQKTPEFKAKARERYKIEAKNAELKHVYGYDRAESYGLCSMQMQGAITIFAANIKRILKLIWAEGQFLQNASYKSTKTPFEGICVHILEKWKADCKTASNGYVQSAFNE